MVPQYQNTIQRGPWLQIILYQIQLSKKSKWVILESSSMNEISGIRYIRNSLYLICVKSGMGCVIIEWLLDDSLSLTAQMECVDGQMWLC